MSIGTLLIIISAALAVSEGLALIPGVKSNSVFQMIYLILKSIVNGIRSKEV